MIKAYIEYQKKSPLKAGDFLYLIIYSILYVCFAFWKVFHICAPAVLLFTAATSKLRGADPEGISEPSVEGAQIVKARFKGYFNYRHLCIF